MAAGKSAKTMTAMDAARMAMALDTDGNIDCNFRRSKPQYGPAAGATVRISVFNCDVRLLEWCLQITGVGHIDARPARGKYHRPQFTWMASCKQAEEVIIQCLPYFIVKREQADIALAIRRTIMPASGKRQRLDPDTVANREWLHRQLSELKHG